VQLFVLGVVGKGSPSCPGEKTKSKKVGVINQHQYQLDGELS